MKNHNQSTTEDRFQSYFDEALRQPFEGWDFRFLADRMTEEGLPWHYPDAAAQKAGSAKSLLDMGTGGGELLSTWVPFSGTVLATEAYLPNIRVAAARLHPLQVQVVAVDDGEEKLPFPQSAFDQILNRHESYHPPELFRVLAPEGSFYTQQVGGRDNFPLNEALQDKPGAVFEGWSCENAVNALESVGFEVLGQEEAFPQVLFHDIGAVIFYLQVIPWQIPGFSVVQNRESLFALHQKIEREGGLRSYSHRFLIEARKPV